MLGALILIAQTAQARDFDHAGAPVQRVIEQIAKAYGEKAKADGTLSRDYLILDLRNETFERAKSLIAKTLNASWQQDKHGTWILHRSKQQEQQDEHKEYEARVAAIKRYQAAIKVPARLNGRITEDFITQVVAATTLNDNKQMSDLFQRSPANRALDRLSKELDPEFLASLPTSGVVLLSAYDTVGTIAMPKAARDIIGEALADQNALADVMDIKAGSVKRHFQFSRLADDRAQTYIVVSGATGMPESLSLPLKSGQGSLEVSGGALLMQIDPDRPPLYTWPDSLKSPLVLSDQAREFNRLRPLNFSSSAQVTKPSDALLSYFLDTQDNDVYDLVVGAAVRQAADAEHKSYVVSASATMLGQGMRLSRKTQWTLRDALTILFPPEFADVQRTESAVTIRPTMPVSSRAAEYDRADFARALNSLEHRDKNAVEPVSAVAFESSGMYSRARSWLSYLSRVYFDDSYSQYDVLAVLGALTKSQHQQANEGGAIFTMRQLPSRAAIALRSLVAQKVRYPEVSSVDTSYVDTEETKAFAGDARRALRLPEDARFVIRVETKRLLYGMINADAPYAQPNRWSPETVAQTEYYVSNDPDMGALKFGFLATEPAVVYISVLDSGREVPIAAFIMPTMYEGDSFEPMSKMPDWVKQGYEEGKKHVKKLPPSP